MTGMRKGELLGLCWTDVDLTKGELIVQHTLSIDSSGQLGLGPTKTLRSRRRLLIPLPVVEALDAHRARQETERKESWGAWQPLDLVFTNIVGGPLNPSNIRTRSFHPLLKQAGLPQIRFHDLRHTAASLLLGQGIHPKIVSEMLGHSQISITLDLYSHVSQTMLRQARDAFDDLFGCQVGCQSADDENGGKDDVAI